MTILDELATRSDLPDAERALADYIISHAEEVINMGVSTLARVTRTSTAAVTRLCKRMGVDGYRTLCIQLARELERDRMHLFDVNPDLPFAQGATTRDVMASVVTLSKQALDASYSSIDPHSIRTAAKLIQNARKVALFASGDAMLSALAFSSLLLRLGVTCVPADHYGDYLSVPSVLGPQDVALVISYSGTSIRAQPKQFELLLERKCRIILVTADWDACGAFAHTECVIRLPKDESEEGRIATFYSQSCIRFALNCVYGELFARNWDAAMREQERIAQTTKLIEEQ